MSRHVVHPLGQQVARWIATGLGLGEVLPAPGTTAGSLPATLAWWLLAASLPSSRQVVAASGVLAVTAAVAGLWAAGVEARRRGAADPGPVVIDEVAGQWLAYFVALLLVDRPAGSPLVLFAAAGFLGFRLLDIWKPWPIRAFEQLPGGVGIVADDLAAGALTGVLLAVGWHLIGG